MADRKTQAQYSFKGYSSKLMATPCDLGSSGVLNQAVGSTSPQDWSDGGHHPLSAQRLEEWWMKQRNSYDSYGSMVQKALQQDV